MKSNLHPYYTMSHTWQIFDSFEWLLYGQDSWPVMLLSDPIFYVNPLFLVLLNSGFHIIPNYSWKLKTLLCVPDVSFSDAKFPDHCTHMSNCLFIQVFDICWVHSKSKGKQQWCFAPPPPIKLSQPNFRENENNYCDENTDYQCTTIFLHSKKHWFT